MAKKESSFLNMVLTLFLVTGVAGLALGYVYNITEKPIALSKKVKLEKAIKAVVPEFNNEISKDKQTIYINDKDSVVLYFAKKDDEIVGTAVETYTNKGFSGKFRIMVGFLPDESIYNTSVLEHKETPGLGDKMDAKKSDFSKQFINKNPQNFKLLVKKDKGDVDAITAATISSRAFCDAVQRAYDNYKNNNGGNKK